MDLGLNLIYISFFGKRYKMEEFRDTIMKNISSFMYDDPDLGDLNKYIDNPTLDLMLNLKTLSYSFTDTNYMSAVEQSYINNTGDSGHFYRTYSELMKRFMAKYTSQNTVKLRMEMDLGLGILNPIVRKYDSFFYGECVTSSIYLEDQFVMNKIIVLDNGDIVCASLKKDFRLLDSTLQLKHTFKGHTQGIIIIKIFNTSEGQRIFTASHDGSIRMWNPVSYTCETVFNPKYKYINDLFVLEDKMITVGSTEESYPCCIAPMVWDLQGNLLYTVGKENLLSVNICGDKILTYRGCEMDIFHINGVCEKKITLPYIISSPFICMDNLIVYRSESKICMTHIVTGVTTIITKNKKVGKMILNGDRLICNFVNYINIYNLKTHEHERSFKLNSFVLIYHILVWDYDRIVVCREPGSIIFNISTGKKEVFFALQNDGGGISVLPKMGGILSSCKNKIVQKWQ